MSSEADSNNSNACIVCYKNAEYYSIGMCEHPVCYECSTRMRVLCQQNECPICRQELPKVVFTREVKPFRFLKKGPLFDSRYNIYFECPEIQEKFTELLTHRCSICDTNQVFGSFNNLKEHMKRRHDLHYCELCTDNLKIFTQERRCYTRKELQRHRREGDVDNKSHKGHPLCEFCDIRYMDNDELYRHLRRDHLFCHFCDADGYHHYYRSYDYLRDHFRKEHYLCEEGSCADEQFTSVFRSDIDLKAHKTNVHGRQLGKAAAKQARTLELEFTLAPRVDLRRRGPLGSVRNHDGNANVSRHHHHQHQEPEPEPEFQEEPVFKQPDVQSTEEFPTLGNATPCLVPHMSQPRRNVTIRSTMRAGNYDDNFPALGLEAAAAAAASTSASSVSASSSLTPRANGPATSKSSLNFNISSASRPSAAKIAGRQQQTPKPNLSIHVNHRPNGSVMTRLASGGPSLRITPSTSRALASGALDFPALGRAEPTASQSASWTKVTCVKPAVMPRKQKVAPPPLVYSPPTVESAEQFPSLSKPSKSSKSNSSLAPVTPVTCTWVQATNSDGSSGTDATKGKAKKKKMKQQQQQQSTSNGNASSNESSASSKTLKDQVDSSKKTKSKEVEANKKEKNKSKQNHEFSNSKGNTESSSESSTTRNTEPAPAPSPQRKRSELKIESLNNGNHNNNNISEQAKTPKADEFPALGRRPPPGLTNPPPPGFTASTGAATAAAAVPPPGFVSRTPNGLTVTFTTSSGQILPEGSEREHTYLPPKNSQERNQKLIAEFNNCFGFEKSEELKTAFRYLSGLFRTQGIDAKEYYEQCKTLLGVEAFSRIFPELLALLPDISQQQELFKVHKRECSGRIKNLEACESCGQILRSSDLKEHATSHSLQNHFPALGKSTTTTANASWPKK